jgi:hypothetical protein
METITLSPLELNPSGRIRRTMPRPDHLRQPDYEDKYDFSTVFYDCFKSVNGDWCVFVGPPLRNLEPVVLPELLAAFQGPAPADVSLRHLFCCDQLWIRTDESYALLPHCTFRQAQISVQPGYWDLFDGRKVLLTKSKDNELRWIRDWVRFFASKHGSDAVLFYDNGSTSYDISEIRETITSIPGIEVALVVRWPFKFGPVGSETVHGPQGLPWDSDYSQYGILEHARHRFLGSAEAVVNADVDELVLTKQKDSVFELLSRSETGYLRYPGYWIESATESTNKKRRHFDFTYRLVRETEVSDPKWTVAPHRCSQNSQWGVHDVWGMQPDALSCEVSFRHFRAISTSWKYPRAELKQPNKQDYALDEELATWIEGLRQAYGDRKVAGRFLVRVPILHENLKLARRVINRLVGRLGSFGRR